MKMKVRKKNYKKRKKENQQIIANRILRTKTFKVSFLMHIIYLKTKQKTYLYIHMYVCFSTRKG